MSLCFCDYQGKLDVKLEGMNKMTAVKKISLLACYNKLNHQDKEKETIIYVKIYRRQA